MVQRPASSAQLVNTAEIPRRPAEMHLEAAVLLVGELQEATLRVTSAQCALQESTKPIKVEPRAYSAQSVHFPLLGHSTAANALRASTTMTTIRPLNAQLAPQVRYKPSQRRLNVHAASQGVLQIRVHSQAEQSATCVHLANMLQILH